MNISNELRRKVHELQREFQRELGNVQIVIDNIGAYLVSENSVTKIDQPECNEIITQCNDTLMPYVSDVFTALEEYEQADDCDLDDLLCIATDTTVTNGQRMNAYRRIGDYIQDAQLGNTATSLKKDLQK